MREPWRVGRERKGGELGGVGRGVEGKGTKKEGLLCSVTELVGRSDTIKCIHFWILCVHNSVSGAV